MDLKKITQKVKFKWALAALATVIVLLLIFQLGMLVGFKKASFAYRWAENYSRNFGGPRNGFLDQMRGRDFINGHGTVGEIIKIDKETIVLKSPDNIEKIISVNNDTIIEKGRQSLKLSDLGPDDRIVVIGTPKDNGQISAKMIRVFNSTDTFGPKPF